MGNREIKRALSRTTPECGGAAATLGMELDECDATEEESMHALFWIGLVVLALGILAYIVVKAAVWFAILLFIVGVILMIWGVTKVKRAV